MSKLEEMAEQLADECIAVQEEIGDDRLFVKMGTVIGASSQTLEEAFLSAVRTKLAFDKARHFLADKLHAYQKSQEQDPE
ncbi:hypothetical protein [Pseudaestuariivita rosea]|uniref:hypothetical protein n=1 Tax=Pseudaestuariivita rosea TaxID=2763263 RepID=UPI001F39BFF2|nr:hypothetical protein [Pseudaestuariivita rosea]